MATLHQIGFNRQSVVPPASFTRAELLQMLSVYSRRVAGGEWRDYAIDNCDGKAVFSIFRRCYERPLFSIVKQRAEDEDEYALFSGPEQLGSTGRLSDLLETLESRPRLIQG